ncbi:MAG: hypothetical protein WDA16_11630 [Candidatus Thermoplasmatota archaeon]
MPAKKAAKRTSKKVPKPAAPAPRADKVEGDAAVKAWIAEANPQHRALATRIDEMVADEIPGITKVVK